MVSEQRMRRRLRSGSISDSCYGSVFGGAPLRMSQARSMNVFRLHIKPVQPER